MVAKKNKTSEKEEKKGRVKVGNLEATRELSVEDAKKVIGGKALPKLLEAASKGTVFKKVEIHGTA